MPRQKREAKRESFWLNLGLNIVLPALILTKAEKWLEASGAVAEGAVKPVWFFAAALSFPMAYGLWDLLSRRRWNIFSLFGVLNVLLTGTVGLFELSREWMIAKEAGVPAALGLAVLASAFTKKPLARALLFNDALLDVDLVAARARERGSEAGIASAFKKATVLVAVSFFLSAAIQFFLAKNIFTGPSSGAEFNAQVGKMTWVSYLAVLAPCMLVTAAAMFGVFSDIKKATGLGMEEMLAPELRGGRDGTPGS